MPGFTANSRGLSVDHAEGLPNTAVIATGSDVLGRTQILRTSSIAAPALGAFAFVDDAPWGAKGDVLEISDAAITSGSNQLTTAQHTWTAADTGKAVEVLGSVLATSATHPNQAAYIKVTGGNAFLFSDIGLTTAYNATTTVSGAVARFGTDDSAAIIAAGNAVSAAGGGQVHFNPYKRYWAQKVVPPGNVTYRGNNTTCYVLPLPGLVNPNPFFALPVGADAAGLNVTIQGFRWFGHGQEPSSQFPVQLKGYKNVRVYDCDLLPSPNTGKSFAPNGIYMLDVTGYRIVNCTFDQVCAINPPGTGTTGNPINVSPNTTSDTWPMTEIHVVGNRIDGHTSQAIDMSPGSAGTVPQTVTFKLHCTGNIINAAPGAAGISMELGGGATPTYLPQDVVIANNMLTNCGITTSRQTPPTDPTLLSRFVIAGNIVNNPIVNGLGITYTGSYATITGNVINASLGINLVSGTTTIPLTGDFTNASPTINNVSGGGSVTNGTQLQGVAGIASGVFLLSGAGTTTWTLSANFTGGTATGVAFTAHLSATNVTAANNNVHLSIQSTSPGTAYGIQASFVRNSSWSNNTITFDAGLTNSVGITASNCGYLLIQANSVENSAGRGMLLQTSNDCTITNNRVYNSSAAGAGANGIQAGLGGTVNVITGNTVIDDRAVHLMFNALNITAVVNARVLNNVLLGATNAVIDSLAGVVELRNNSGYNPVGTVTVTVPATTVAVASQPYDRTFYVTAGASTCTMAIQNGPSPVIPASAFASIRVPAGKTVTPTYANAPTWVVEGE